MSASTLQINGAVIVGNGICTPCDNAGSSTTVGFGSQCPSLQFEFIANTASPFLLSSALVFVDVPIFMSFSEIGFVLLQTEGQDLDIRINAAPAELLTTNTEPFTGIDGLALTYAIDGQTAVTVTSFTSDTTADGIANQINSASSLAGQAPPATVVSGQIQFAGVLTGPEGSVDIQSGTALAALGLTAGVTLGTGEDIQSGEIWMQKFARTPNGVSRIQLRGSARVSILAAGSPV